MVAKEVRKLAKRSAAAASEIKTLAARAFGDLSGDIGLVGRVGGSLDAIERQSINRSAPSSSRPSSNRLHF
ncbi:hypothetical protein ATY81_25195 [Rhizobium sp. R72]|uniref:hypothetical protein n=1 Tax=unclassified Rhizobium TaxID=2613769 RepID=UPI000B52DA70|nr:MULTISPECIES: hypothetical protein [unclassified Rhizobium]OWW00097.1 hypothetical protein ATY81_25195 [Rhizobium sp. R72]OWW00488.1 hypothetical protein ATY80_25195 [Rhizobium sp. R711]